MCSLKFLHKRLGSSPYPLPQCPILTEQGQTGTCDKPIVRRYFLDHGHSCCHHDKTCLLLEEYPNASRLELRAL